MTLKRYVVPLLPFLLTIPAIVVALRLNASWHTDTHDTCSTPQPYWNTASFFWAPGLSVAGIAAGIFCCWTPETPRALRIAGPGAPFVVLVWSIWFFFHTFRLDWCL